MKVMLVADDREFGEELAVFLQHAGYETERCDDCMAAFDAVQRVQPAVIILDLKMDGIGGYQLAWCLRKLKEKVSIPVIVLSGYAAESDPVVAAGKCGMNAFLQKPFPPADLVAMIEHIVSPPACESGPGSTGRAGRKKAGTPSVRCHGRGEKNRSSRTDMQQVALVPGRAA